MIWISIGIGFWSEMSPYLVKPNYASLVIMKLVFLGNWWIPVNVMHSPPDRKCSVKFEGTEKQSANNVKWWLKKTGAENGEKDDLEKDMKREIGTEKTREGGGNAKRRMMKRWEKRMKKRGNRKTE